MIFTIIIAITAGAIFCWYYYKGIPLGRSKVEPVATEEEATPKETEEMKKYYDDRIQLQPFEEARYLTVEKVIRTQIEKEDGTVETQYDSYLIADIDLASNLAGTTDYSNASVGDGFEISEGQVIDFQTAFGFDYEKMDGKTMYEQLLLSVGITGNLDEATFDQDTYDKTGQRIYELVEKENAVEKLMEGIAYDELLSSKVFYQSMEDADGNIVPDYFVVITQYKVGDDIATRNLFLQVTMNPEVVASYEHKE